ncbi:MAG: chloride channel protein [Phycisphaerae bacterium]
MTNPPRLLDRFRTFAARAVRGISRLWDNPDRQLWTLALIIGIVTGLGAIAFSKLVDVVLEFSFERVGEPLKLALGSYALFLILPMVGALLVGIITNYFAPEAQGHGVPEVMDSIARKGGKIRPRVAVAKAVSSALTIGSGGSAGTEGPIIQIGAAIGSGFGQWLRVNVNDIRVLIGCGASAGIASIFNAPIAGVLFAVEVLLRDVSQRSFVPIILSAVLSTAVTHAVRGTDTPIFPIPLEFTGAEATHAYVFSVEEFLNYALLGVVCGLVAVAIIKALYFAEDMFAKLPVHRIVRPVIGAAMLGCLVIVFMPLLQKIPHPGDVHLPAIMGYGYAVIKQTLATDTYGAGGAAAGAWTFSILLILAVTKLTATCFTLGSGGSGGVFAPSLFMGATVGGAFGMLVQHTGFFPDAAPGAYALVGMAAVVAATIHAPLAAALMLFELTQDYKVIIPIMLAAVLALAVSSRIEHASIYTLKLLRKGVRIGSGDLRMLQRIAVSDLPRIAAPVVAPTDAVDKLVRIMRTSSANDFVVIDKEGEFSGMVLGDDLRTMLLESEAMPLLTVSDVVRADVPLVHMDETLDIVLNKFAGQPMQSIPVVDPQSPSKVRELITRAAVMNRYHQAIATTTPS